MADDSFLKKQLDLIDENISTDALVNDGFFYYEFLSKLHLLLVKNGVRKAYFDSITLKNPEHFKDCQFSDVNSIIIKTMGDFVKPQLQSLDNLKKISKKLGLNVYELIQCPLPFHENDVVPQEIIKEFSATYSNGRNVWIYLKSNIRKQIIQIIEGKLGVSDFLEYPKCCVDWMTTSKTESLKDCYCLCWNKHLLPPSDESTLEFLRTYFESDYVANNDERIKNIEKNHLAKTISDYPFVFHQACKSCLENSNSPTAKLNEKYGKFARLISEEFYQKISNEGKRLSNFMLKDLNRN